MARVALPQEVRAGEPWQHIVGFVEADDSPVVKSLTPSYLVLASVFNSPQAADRALALKPEWIEPGSRSSQFQKDNVIVVISGARPSTERWIAALEAALDEFANG
jgi:hypothetical protein